MGPKPRFTCPHRREHTSFCWIQTEPYLRVPNKRRVQRAAVDEFLRTISQIGIGLRPGFPERTSCWLKAPLRAMRLSTLTHRPTCLYGPISPNPEDGSRSAGWKATSELRSRDWRSNDC